MQMGISNDLGVEYFENLNNHITDLTTNEVRIPFKWSDWDKYTYGRYSGKSALYVYYYGATRSW